MAENAKPSANLLKRLKTTYVFVRFEHESLYLFCIGFSVLCHFWHMGEVKNWPLRKTQRKTTQEVEENDIHKSAFSKMILMKIWCDGTLTRIRTYFRKPSYEQTTWSAQNPYRQWSGFSRKTTSMPVTYRHWSRSSWKTTSMPVRILSASCGLLVWGFPEIAKAEKSHQMTQILTGIDAVFK